MNKRLHFDAPSALARLREGNQRFVHNVRSVDSTLSHSARRGLVEAHDPIAIVLSCSDSRAPAELVFDQGLGDLFVVRVAGNVVDAVVTGSVEFAVERLGTALIVVMGHSNCGVIAATFDEVSKGSAGDRRSDERERSGSPGLDEIIDFVRPAMVRAHRSSEHATRAEILAEATRHNVRTAVDRLRNTASIGARVSGGQVSVVGAEYSLETGQVEFFDDARR
ncbi:MAG: carbonic anhydrase [Myxococcales bacterium]|nr:carbonic anhydrase [Myxococcales bacterium]